MLGSLFGIDWKKSSAHFLFLSKFYEPRSEDDFNSEEWKNALKESPSSAIKRLIGDEMLMRSSINEQLSHKFKISELKSFLKDRNLPVSGKKSELVNRLVLEDLEGMKKLVIGLRLIQCTEQGKAVSDRYIREEQDKRDNTRQNILKLIENKKFKDAAAMVAKYESDQVFKRGIGINWKNYDTRNDEESLRAIFKVIPSQLAKCPPNELNKLRIATAMMWIWVGDNEKISCDLPSIGSLSGIAATRIISNRVHYEEEIAKFRNAGIKFVEINTCNDSYVCPECKKISNKKHRIANAPILPYDKCTCGDGCRCWVSPAY